MKIDTERIQRYLSEIKARHYEIEGLLRNRSDSEILKEPWTLKGLKYTLVEVAEAMANTLQHILAKELGEPMTGYVETIIRAAETSILPETLSSKLRPFFDFRNAFQFMISVSIHAPARGLKIRSRSFGPSARPPSNDLQAAATLRVDSLTTDSGTLPRSFMGGRRL